MFGVFHSYGLQLPFHFRHVCNAVRHKQNPCLKIVSCATKPTNPAAFTVDYLIKSCGFSPAKALSTASKVSLSSAERADSVMSLFRNNGFSDTQVRQVVSKHPVILSYDPDQDLQPKLDFFNGLGASESDAVELLVTDPSILSMSLDNHIIPNFDLLKSYVGTDENVWRVLSRSTRSLRTSILTVIEPNITVLRGYGVPDENILKLLLTYPETLAKDPDSFKAVVEKVKEMEFNPLVPLFCYAVRSMGSLRNGKWEKKMLLFQNFGWSEKEVYSLFKKQPAILALSEKKLEKALKFFMEERKWTREAVLSNPRVLYFSIEKTIIPRYTVLEVLISNGIKLNVGPALASLEKEFMERYVIRYQEYLPEVLRIYNPLRKREKKNFITGETILERLQNILEVSETK